MRFLYIDIDSQRADHLGCYGYHRNTSPTIDALAAESLRFESVYVSDAPCLPSRTALFSGRFGAQTGIIGHGGTAADMFIEGPERGFGSTLGRTSWPRTMRDVGMHTTSISPFAERHAAWHFYAGFNEVLNTGGRGLESAHDITPVALDWIDRHKDEDNWFLHLNLWDPHTPYRAPEEFGEPFADQALPSWLTEEVRREHWRGCGPHSAQEAVGYQDVGEEYKRLYPRQPYIIDSMAQVRRMFDGYDTGVLYADHHIAKILDRLRSVGLYEDVAILVSGDHGETLGEFNIYGDHQTADEHTCHVPAILKWPGLTDSLAGQVESGLHYQFDIAATITELLGGTVPTNWNGQSFASQLREQQETGRESLIISQGAWTCQRSLRFRDSGQEWLYLRSYHDGHHGFPESMLFNLATDLHEQHDLAKAHPDLCNFALAQIDYWLGKRMRESDSGVDPMWTVMREGGPKHTRGELRAYLDRLRKTSRGHWADLLESRHA